MDDFLIRAVLAGLGVALVAGPLGSFVVWRRMAYFGDTLAHAALLGVALGLLVSVDLTLATVALGVGIAFLLVILERRRRVGTDTLLGILSHGGLALGLVAVSFLEGVRVDLTAYLFGDVLAATTTDLGWIWGGGGLVLALLVLLWRPLLAATVHPELAEVEGVKVTLVGLAFMVLLALAVALAMKVVGILLVTALLIIPAAAARPLARTPEAMAVIAAAIGALAVVTGLEASMLWDTPPGASIVVAALAVFGLTSLRRAT